MAALPYIQLYIAEYLADTAHLTTVQHGAYLLLIFNYWQRGKPLSSSSERLASVARMSNDEWAAIEPVIAEFFEVTSSEWIHRRIESDLLTVLSKSTKASAAGKASARKRYQSSELPFNGRCTDDEPLRTDTEQIKTNTSAFAAKTILVDKLLGTLPLNDGSEWEVYLSEVEALQPLYPAVDVRQELRNMKGWLLGNPTNRKTKRGIRRFITGWLAKEQDKAKPNGGVINGKSTDRAFQTAANLVQEIEDHHGTHAGELLPWSGAE